METSSQKTPSALNQLQSPLFKPPAEIRDAIFEYALDGQTLHVITYRNRSSSENTSTTDTDGSSQIINHQQSLHHVACSRSTKEYCSGCEAQTRILACGPSQPFLTISALMWTADFQPGENLLADLLTCRRIYRRTTSVLYSTNTFDFSDLFTLLDFVGLDNKAPDQRLSREKYDIYTDIRLNFHFHAMCLRVYGSNGWNRS